MPGPPLHSEVSPALSQETGLVVLGIGIVVLVVICYDIYRHRWTGND